MTKLLLKLLFIAIGIPAFSQTNILTTNPVAEQIMLGNYTPSTYQPTTVIDNPQTITQDINNRVSPSSLKSYLEGMKAFENRNTGSDTVSTTRGMGAARRWAHNEFEKISTANENRLVVSYLQFDQDICGMGQHRNIIGVLPGSQIEDKSIIIIEGHFDSRCEDGCDIDCVAEGMEDNGSGSALVMELARVMSKYHFKNTIVFMLTTGEEQGLAGANALATYCEQKNIAIKAVLNNDVIGGIICGKTSSPPSCPGENEIDSTQVRIFSAGGFASPHKGLARFIKLEYEEELLSYVKVPMMISVMSAVDRTGRGGDHIPFSNKKYTAVRFTSANEHGDGHPGAGYGDRQHTANDILGVDTDNDKKIDSFFVDFNYLARNAVINANAAVMAAQGPKTPDFILTKYWGRRLVVEIATEKQYKSYRVGIRSATNDWDSVYTMTGQLKDTFIVEEGDIYFISVASVDDNGVESLFSLEQNVLASDVANIKTPNNNIELIQNKPNPFDEATIIGVKVNKNVSYDEAYISITDMQGKEVYRYDITLEEGINEILYTHGYNVTGVYLYTLIIDGHPIQTKRMIFDN